MANKRIYYQTKYFLKQLWMVIWVRQWSAFVYYRKQQTRREISVQRKCKQSVQVSEWQQGVSEMNSTSLYVSTCRLVLQADSEDASTWTDLYRLVPYLRQSLSCTVCGNLLIEPFTPTDTNCQHHVCKVRTIIPDTPCPFTLMHIKGGRCGV